LVGEIDLHPDLSRHNRRSDLQRFLFRLLESSTRRRDRGFHHNAKRQLFAASQFPPGATSICNRLGQIPLEQGLLMRSIVDQPFEALEVGTGQTCHLGAFDLPDQWLWLRLGPWMHRLG